MRVLRSLLEKPSKTIKVTTKVGRWDNFTKFEKREQDYWPTPQSAVVPLLPFIDTIRMFAEPCVGEGHIVRWLENDQRKATWTSDAEVDARTHQYPTNTFEAFITNPPWSRPVMHEIIENLRRQKTTWMLIDADWMHTKQAIEYLKYCRTIISIGRVQWVPNSTSTGTRNCCWYEFGKLESPTVFYGRS